MLTDSQARAALKELIEKHLMKRDPDFDHLIEIVQDSSRPIPIRGVLECVRRNNKAPFTKKELELIDDFLYMYG
jgi:hypothetical protein